MSFLKSYHEDESGKRPKARRAPSTVKKQLENEIAKILDHRSFRASKKNKRTEYLIQWKGEGEANGTWDKVMTLW